MHCSHCILVEPYKKKKESQNNSIPSRRFFNKEHSDTVVQLLVLPLLEGRQRTTSIFHPGYTFPIREQFLDLDEEKTKKQWPCCAILKQSTALRDLFLIHVALFFYLPSTPIPYRSLCPHGYLPSPRSESFLLPVFPATIQGPSGFPVGGGVVTWLFRA